MIVTTEQLKRIVGAGGGLTLDASKITLNQLKELLPAANAGKANIILKNFSGLTAAQLEELASLAPGLVAFDMTA